MSLFDNLDPTQGEETIAIGAQIVATRLDGLPAPRSLAELDLVPADHDWLVRWAADLPAAEAQSWLDPLAQNALVGRLFPLRRPEAIGALLLLCSSEIARREAREGFLWPAIQALFAPETRRILFSVQGQPTQVFKDALEAAAYRLHLRHVFGLEGTQNYHVTVYLQFGFTRRGLIQLPHWLVGQPSEAIQHLIGAGLGSRSFQQVWQALRQYRRNNITERQVRRVLEESPWVLRDWVDEVIQRSREKLGELGTGEDRPGGAGEEAYHFLGAPRLRWDPPAPPVFRCPLTNLALFDLAAERYDLVSGATHLTTLLRQPNETYRQPDDVELPATASQHVVSLIDPEGGIVESQTVVLWDPADEVTIYDLSGGHRAADAWQAPLGPRRPHALLTAPDLEIVPDLPVWRLIGGGHRRISLLPADGPPDLEVRLGGEALWTPLAGGVRQPGVEPEWAEGIWLTHEGDREVSIGDVVQPRLVEIPAGVEVDFVRLNGRPIDYAHLDATAILDPVALTPDLAVQGAEIGFGLRHSGDRAQVRRRLRVHVVGALRSTEDGWEAISEDSPLTVEEARRHLFRLFLPSAWLGSQLPNLALFEGMTFSRRLWHAARPIGTLAGLGAPLEVWNNAYNPTKRVLRLARSVVSPGIIRAVSRTESGQIEIGLTRDLAPGEHHAVVVWPIGQRPRLVRPGRIAAAGPDLWRVRDPAPGSGDLLVAIAYAGARVGAWWPDTLADVWEAPPNDVLPPIETAALVRWFRLPILAEPCVPAFRRFARVHAPGVLRAWLLGKGLPPVLEAEETTEEWLAAVRWLFWGWQPQPDQVRQIAAGLVPELGDAAFRTVVRLLMRLDPALLQRVIAAWPRELRSPGSQGSLAPIARALRFELAGVPPDQSDFDYKRRQAELLGQVAEVMHVDRNFVEQALIRPSLQAKFLDGLPARNLATALAVAPFRTLLGLRVLAQYG